ncbi:hypothetical protein [Cryobacterium sp. HLT2-28]|uniref:hypothetical protein n=1 Tax=Cryobacterium sp. HLT2-28 TaxID=1259146 RepID=UPI00106A7455|nr:hypothetical protein [Cryobacterium sp. HLT2-28]TFB91455.1 hypothetical protein E3O48_15645 [Cryobacterium sp. HLT2-28]
MSSNGFSLAADVISVHGERGDSKAQSRPQKGVVKKYRSLPASSFLLTFAAAEAAVKDANREERFVREGSPHGIQWPLLVSSWAALGVPLLARARVIPQPGATTGIHRWMLLEGEDLSAYLSDAARLRNQLAHRASTSGIALTSEYFSRDGGELKSMTLMLAEGFLQAAQDVSFQVLGRRGDSRLWEWALPERSGTSRMTRKLHRHPAFPLPE